MECGTHNNLEKKEVVLTAMPGNFCCVLIGHFGVAFCCHVKITLCAEPFMTMKMSPVQVKIDFMQIKPIFMLIKGFASMKTHIDINLGAS